MARDINYISIKDFREKGFLQEANRLFFHPLGLALEVEIDEETGDEHISGVWDYREDPEGMLFGNNMIDSKKARYVEDLRLSKIEARKETAECSSDGIQYLD